MENAMDRRFLGTLAKPVDIVETPRSRGEAFQWLSHPLPAPAQVIEHLFEDLLQDGLSPREAVFLKLALSGHSIKGIAHQLSSSIAQVLDVAYGLQVRCLQILKSC